MLRARVTNSTKFAKAKIFMMVADKWMLFNYNIKMYVTNKKNNSHINNIFPLITKHVCVLTCETIVIDVASSNTFVNL